jgi:4-hydroxybenzoate polyprenyltransferase
MTSTASTQSSTAASAPATTTGTLYVDMDGVLFASDSAWEALLRLLKRRPLMLLMLLFWLARGRAYLKQQLGQRAKLSPASLPFRQPVIELIKEQRRSGRRVVLATAGDAKIAHDVAEHLRCFDAVLASDGHTNLRGAAKRRAIEQDSNGQPWDYIGDAHADLAVWPGSRTALVAGARPRLLRQVRALGCNVQVICDAPSPWQSLLRACRPHQWVKNVLVAVPLLVSHRLHEKLLVIQTALAFVIFCMVASGAYLLNDLLDLPSDRLHPNKRNRPFASGTVSIPIGLVTSALLLAGGVILSYLLLGAAFAGLVALYVCVTTAYSLDLKRRLVLDVFVLAALYALRVLAGTVATGIKPSDWLLAFATFSFISLAFVKRYADLTHARDFDIGSAAGRGYSVNDTEMFKTFGPASAYMAGLIFCLYISSPDVVKLYARPELLWLACPLLLYWMTRLWFIADRGYRLEDPVLFTLRDRVSWIVAIVLLALLLCAGPIQNTAPL